MSQLYNSLHEKESNSGHYRGTCTPMFTEELFTTGNAWDQPRHQAMSEHIKRWDGCIYTVQFSSAKEKNEYGDSTGDECVKRNKPESQR